MYTLEEHAAVGEIITAHLDLSRDFDERLLRSLAVKEVVDEQYSGLPLDIISQSQRPTSTPGKLSAASALYSASIDTRCVCCLLHAHQTVNGKNRLLKPTPVGLSQSLAGSLCPSFGIRILLITENG